MLVPPERPASIFDVSVVKPFICASTAAASACKELFETSLATDSPVPERSGPCEVGCVVVANCCVCAVVVDVLTVSEFDLELLYQIQPMTTKIMMMTMVSPVFAVFDIKLCVIIKQ